VARRRSAEADHAPAPAFGSAAEEALVASFVRAYEASDIDALVALLTDDVFVSMPPMPYEYEGREAAMRFCDLIFRDGRRFDLVPTRANGQPAFGLYLHAPDGLRHAAGFLVLTLSGNRVSAMTRFENGLLPSFGLPRTLPPR
jgi:RNA polymerase sigma-70 factor (ECF subfamily)